MKYKGKLKDAIKQFWYGSGINILALVVSVVALIVAIVVRIRYS